MPGKVRTLVSGLSDAQLDTPYRPGGWTVRQVVHHVPDSHLNAYVRMKLAVTEDKPGVKTYEEARWAELPEAKNAPDRDVDRPARRAPSTLGRLSSRTPRAGLA